MVPERVKSSERKVMKTLMLVIGLAAIALFSSGCAGGYYYSAPAYSPPAPYYDAPAYAPGPAYVNPGVVVTGPTYYGGYSGYQTYGGYPGYHTYGGYPGYRGYPRGPVYSHPVPYRGGVVRRRWR
jgi:hypothetical protein